KAGYKLLEAAYKEGKIKAIGLSNFSEEDLEWVLGNAEIKPHMVQVEAHPYYSEKELKKILDANGMGLMAWYPLGHGDKSLVQERIFSDLAEKYGKSNAQIILRWHTQSGHVVIPGSRNPQHIRDNFDIFDFRLTDDEMAEIAKLDNGRRYYSPDPDLVARYAEMDMDFDAQK
ncbi:MAG: aldo/keto reductase, partial [Anaerovoracaceae bacterium]